MQVIPLYNGYEIFIFKKMALFLQKELKNHMKKYFLASCLLLLTFIAQAQNKKNFPAVNIKTLDGKPFNTKDLDNNGKPMVVSFWATWCKPCIQELMNISEVYEQWQKETGVKLIAISIDDARNTAKVPGFVKGKDWKYEVYLDPNSDLKRELGVNNVPHTFLLDGNKNIVWDHNSYTNGDEEKLYELIQKLTKGEPIKE